MLRHIFVLFSSVCRGSVPYLNFFFVFLWFWLADSVLIGGECALSFPVVSLMDILRTTWSWVSYTGTVARLFFPRYYFYRVVCSPRFSCLYYVLWLIPFNLNDYDSNALRLSEKCWKFCSKRKDKWNHCCWLFSSRTISFISRIVGYVFFYCVLINRLLRKRIGVT